MATTHGDKVASFRKLHEGQKAFIIPNAWDASSARALAGLGFQAIATSSGACAAMLGRRDGQITREEALAHSRIVIAATDLPVSADLEKGFGDSPEEAAKTIRLAAEAGLAGGSIEDATGDREKPLYDLNHAIERITAAVEAARTAPGGFVLSARAEGCLRGKPDLEDIIRRLQAFEKAGADVLFAPGLPDLKSVKAVCGALERPFNFMVGIRGKSFSLAELEAVGVRRISLATSLYRAAMSGLVSAAKEVRDGGTFGYVETSLATAELNAVMKI